MYYTKNLIKNLSKVFLFSILFLLGIREIYGLFIDGYNFNQLKESKTILDTIPKDAEKFYTLKEFNEKYNANIKPIKNCYYISNSNGNEKYIFGFQLESLTFIIFNLGIYYSYPKYDLPIHIMLTGGVVNGKVAPAYDYTKSHFKKIVSRPCKD